MSYAIDHDKVHDLASFMINSHTRIPNVISELADTTLNPAAHGLQLLLTRKLIYYVLCINENITLSAASFI